MATEGVWNSHNTYTQCIADLIYYIHCTVLHSTMACRMHSIITAASASQAENIGSRECRERE